MALAWLLLGLIVTSTKSNVLAAEIGEPPIHNYDNQEVMNPPQETEQWMESEELIDPEKEIESEGILEPERGVESEDVLEPEKEVEDTLEPEKDLEDEYAAANENEGNELTDAEGSMEQQGIASGAYTYRLEGSNAYITGYTGTSNKITIPVTIGGYKVVGIDIGSTMNPANSRVSEIVVSEGIEEIEYMGLGHFENLTAVRLPFTLKYIWAYAFYGCERLTTITIPPNVQVVGRGAFGNCVSLTRITFLNGTTEVVEGAFANESGLSNGLRLTIISDAGWTVEDAAHREGASFQTSGKACTTKLPKVSATSYGKNQTLIMWENTSGIKVDGYLVYAQKNGVYAYCGMLRNVDDKYNSKGSFIDKKAVDSEYNFYWVFPYYTNREGKMIVGQPTNYVYAKGICKAVSNLKAASVQNGVKLTWTKSNGAEGYLVYGKTATGKYGYIGMTNQGTTYIDKNASKKEYNFYWVYPYHKNASGKMIVGGVPKYVYGKAR